MPQTEGPLPTIFYWSLMGTVVGTIGGMILRAKLRGTLAGLLVGFVGGVLASERSLLGHGLTARTRR